jgi:hypothetical protein
VYFVVRMVAICIAFLEGDHCRAKSTRRAGATRWSTVVCTGREALVTRGAMAETLTSTLTLTLEPRGPAGAFVLAECQRRLPRPVAVARIDHAGASAGWASMPRVRRAQAG